MVKIVKVFLPHKIHYQIFDALGRVERVLVDNDASVNKKEEEAHTGKLQTDNAGQPVTDIDQVLRYDYNLKGELIQTERDNNVDGKYDYLEFYTLDTNGYRLQKEIDLTNDGKFDKKEVYINTSAGGLDYATFYNLVADGKGSIKPILLKTEDYELNPNNYRTKLSLDVNGDGTTNSITSYTKLYPNGLAEVAEFDTDGNGQVDRIERYIRDVNGNIERTEIKNAQGEIQVVRTYDRNPLGQVREYEIDNGNDTTIDTKYLYTRDLQGNEESSKQYSYNAVTDQLELTTSIERTFNELNQASVAHYIYEDTTRNYTINYTYDEYGRRVSEQFSGALTRRWDYKYDDNGLVSERLDYNAQGDYTGKTVFKEYYIENNLSKLVESYNANNGLRDTSIYLRDANGAIVNSLVDQASNGTGTWDTLTFGDRGATTGFNTSLDITVLSESKLTELGNSLSLIRMGNGGVSNLTLNAEVVAQISNGSLRVQGAADKNDVLNLSGFEKAASSDLRGYDLYTASFESEDLKLYVQANDSISVIG